jgi:hypothetical protein
MIPRILAALILVTTVTQAPSAELSGHELKKFLGPVSPDLCSWQKVVTPDSEGYVGTAKPPLNGSVDITMLLWTWKIDLGSIEVGGPDHLGVLEGHRYESSYEDSNHQLNYQVSFNFADLDDRKIMVNIVSPSKSDADRLAAEVARLPMFNATPSAPFRALILRRRVGLILTYAVFPLLFFATLWFSNRALRKRSHWARLAAAILVCLIYPAVFYTAWLFRSNFEQLPIVSAMDLQRTTLWMILLGLIGLAVSVLITIARLIWYVANKLFFARA